MAEKGAGAPATLAITVAACQGPREVREWVPVSYTHLTLPTNREV